MNKLHSITSVQQVEPVSQITGPVSVTDGQTDSRSRDATPFALHYLRDLRKNKLTSVAEMMKFYIAVLAALVVSVAADHAPGHVGQHYQAVAFLRGDGVDPVVQGNITFTQQDDGKVVVDGTILGLEHGKYGFHIHEKGDITGGCLSTGGHFNPEKKQHGAPTDLERHVGDLGNVEFDAYRIARVNIVDDQICLFGNHGIVGRAVVLHSGIDDLGRGTHPDSRKTGNAGGRVACGVIGILSPVDGWKSTSSSESLVPATSSVLTVVSLFFYRW